ncbi:MAG: hypothetical protein ACE5FP_06955 [Gemmatimonadota bacterium]
MPTWILIIIVIVFVCSPLANAVAKAIESRASRPSLDHDEEGAQRISGLEEQMQFLSDQVHELADKQDFLTRLLEASPAPPASAEPEDRIG